MVGICRRPATASRLERRLNRFRLGRGDVPSIFALATGANFVYIAYEFPTPEAERILANKDSPIRKIAELKGNKVDFNKGSHVHWLVDNALESDIQPICLPPPDARAAFQRGAVDTSLSRNPRGAYQLSILSENAIRLLKPMKFRAYPLRGAKKNGTSAVLWNQTVIPPVMADQQTIAHGFFIPNLIPKKLDVSEATCRRNDEGSGMGRSPFY
jgi:hypothetical protein